MNASMLAFHGFIVDYTYMNEGAILVHRRDGCITDADLDLIKSIVTVPDYMVWKSDYQTVTIG